MALLALPLTSPPAPAPFSLAVDGTRREIDLKNCRADDVARAVQRLRDSATGSGRRRYNSPTESQRPTVQGVWDPAISYAGFEIKEGTVPKPKVVKVAAADAPAASAAAPSPPLS